MFLIPCVCVCVCVCRLMLVTENNRFPLEFITTVRERTSTKKEKSGIFYKTTHANTSRTRTLTFQLHLRLRNTDTIASSGWRVQGVTVGAALEELSPQEKRKNIEKSGDDCNGVGNEEWNDVCYD